VCSSDLIKAICVDYPDVTDVAVITLA
jgi:hypothetical protein